MKKYKIYKGRYIQSDAMYVDVVANETKLQELENNLVELEK